MCYRSRGAADAHRTAGRTGTACKPARSLKARNPAPRQLMLTSFLDQVVVTAAIAGSVDGCVLKEINGPDLAAGVRRIHGRGAFLNPRVTRHVIDIGRSGQIRWRNFPPRLHAISGFVLASAPVHHLDLLRRRSDGLQPFRRLGRLFLGQEDQPLSARYQAQTDNQQPLPHLFVKRIGSSDCTISPDGGRPLIRRLSSLFCHRINDSPDQSKRVDG